MSNREKRLTAVVVLLALLWGGNWAWQSYTDWETSATAARDTTSSNLQTALLDEKRTKAAVQRLREWREKSLPADVQVAQSQYRGWLLEKLQDADMDIDNVTPMATGSGQRNDAYQSLTYSVNADGKLESVIKFLDSFYRSDQLHKISVLRLFPVEGGDDLRVTLTVEALVVSGTERKSGLAEGVSDRLALESGEKYVDRIVSRNPFRPYAPPPPPKPKVVQRESPKPAEKPKFDHAEQANFTGSVTEGNELQAWVHAKTLGEMFRVKKGDELKVGQFEGTVVEVRNHELLVETADGVLSVRIGDSLREGRLLATEGAGT